MSNTVKVFAAFTVLCLVVLGLVQVWMPDMISTRAMIKILSSIAIVFAGVVAFSFLTDKDEGDKTDTVSKTSDDGDKKA